MPAITYPKPQLVGTNKDETVSTGPDLLRRVERAFRCHTKGPEKRPILRSSFDSLPADSSIVPHKEGLVAGIIRAFQQDLHLVLKPDDIWLAIITQFNFYVNANVEPLRHLFVAHEGKKELEIDVQPFPVQTVNVGKMAQEFARLIHENIVDPELRDWIMPKFTTTDENDRSVAAMMMMSTMQGYFAFTLFGGCGFPSVTLLGEKSDWEEILQRVKRLPKYGVETAEFSRLLVPVIKRMIKTFDEPDSEATKDFWLRACHSAGVNGSFQFKSLSGWLTAFCFWNRHGKRVFTYSEDLLRNEQSGATYAERRPLTLDGVRLPIISPSNLPTGLATVPVTVMDFMTGLKYETTIVAGTMGMVVSEGQTKVQAKSGWWMLQDKVEEMNKEDMGGLSAVDEPLEKDVPVGTDGENEVIYDMIHVAISARN